jgi:ATPase subunit of ABC transporter with duplicated ATPase domains
MYVGNYDFWYDSSQLIQKLIKEKNKKSEDKISELEEFVRRFSANKSKSRQATSRKKLIEKIKIEEMPASTRRYPWVGFKMDREPGKDRLFLTEVTKTINDEKILDNINLIMGRDDKIAIIGENENTITTVFKLLAEELEPDKGDIKWGVSTTQSYFPKDNTSYFSDGELTIIDWIRQYSEDKRESYLRTFLGRMLFTGDDVYKEVRVLSGGEKVRCMLSRLMLSGASVLLLDQPTNHLDLESVAALNNGLTDFKGNIIFTTHDHQLIQTVANRIIEFKDGKLIDRVMTYDEYVESMKSTT